MAIGENALKVQFKDFTVFLMVAYVGLIQCYP